MILKNSMRRLLAALTSLTFIFSPPHGESYTGLQTREATYLKTRGSGAMVIRTPETVDHRTAKVIDSRYGNRNFEVESWEIELFRQGPTKEYLTVWMREPPEQPRGHMTDISQYPFPQDVLDFRWELDSLEERVILEGDKEWDVHLLRVILPRAYATQEAANSAATNTLPYLYGEMGIAEIDTTEAQKDLGEPVQITRAWLPTIVGYVSHRSGKSVYVSPFHAPNFELYKAVWGSLELEVARDIEPSVQESALLCGRPGKGKPLYLVRDGEQLYGLRLSRLFDLDFVGIDHKGNLHVVGSSPDGRIWKPFWARFMETGMVTFPEDAILTETYQGWQGTSIDLDNAGEGSDTDIVLGKNGVSGAILSLDNEEIPLEILYRKMMPE